MSDFTDDLPWECYRPRTVRPRCTRCGAVCVWSNDKGKWRLYKNGAPHLCNPVKPTDFEAVIDGTAET